MLDKKGKKPSQTLTKQASLQIKHNQLHHHMQTLVEVQKIYVPGLASLEDSLTCEDACDMDERMGASHDAISALLLI